MASYPNASRCFTTGAAGAAVQCLPLLTPSSGGLVLYAQPNRCSNHQGIRFYRVPSVGYIIPGANRIMLAASCMVCPIGGIKAFIFKEKTMKQYIELNEFGLWIDAIAELIKKGVTFRAFIKPDTGASCPYFIELTGGY